MTRARSTFPVDAFRALWERSRSAGQAPEGTATGAWRRDAFARAEALGLPTKRDEAYKYTSLAEIAKTGWQWPSLSEESLSAARALLQADEGARGVPGTRLVFVDGVLAPALSAEAPRAPGVRFALLSELHTATPDAGATDMVAATARWWASVDSSTLDAHCALVGAMARHGVALEVGEGVTVGAPVHLVHVAVAEAPVFAPVAHTFRVGAGGSLSVYEHFLAAPEAAGFTAVWTRFEVGAGARVRRVSLAEGTGQHRLIEQVDVEQQGRSRFESSRFAIGGALSRASVRARLHAPDAMTSLDGLSLVRDRDHVDQQTRIEHLAPDCESSQLFKGIAEGRGHAVFAGKVYVDRVAQRTQAEQRNANLLLSEDAEIDTKPELEIYADDVKCAHGATVGALDEDALFYLRARGIDAESARSLITYGFAAEMVARLPTASLQRWIGAAVKRWMPDSPALRLAQELEAEDLEAPALESGAAEPGAGS